MAMCFGFLKTGSNFVWMICWGFASDVELLFKLFECVWLGWNAFAKPLLLFFSETLTFFIVNLKICAFNYTIPFLCNQK